MVESKSYTGSCHCGKVRYEFTAAVEGLAECNCSICSRAAYLMLFVPGAQFKLLAGEAELTDYLFNKHTIHHPFCRSCGIRSFGWGTDKDGAKTYMVNARCLDGALPDGLEVKKFDGKSL